MKTIDNLVMGDELVRKDGFTNPNLKIGVTYVFKGYKNENWIYLKDDTNIYDKSHFKLKENIIPVPFIRTINNRLDIIE